MSYFLLAWQEAALDCVNVATHSYFVGWLCRSGDIRQTSGRFLISWCPKNEKKHALCFQVHQWCKILDTFQIYDKKKAGEENIVKGLSKCANTRHFFFFFFFILPKWMVSSHVLHSESRSACRCVFSKTITVPSLFLVLRDTDLFFYP